MDGVFGPAASQQEVYNGCNIKSMVSAVIRGYKYGRSRPRVAARAHFAPKAHPLSSRTRCSVLLHPHPALHAQSGNMLPSLIADLRRSRAVLDRWECLVIFPLLVLPRDSATIFAYGQTGSGKTFTMEGYPYEGSGEGLGDARARVRPVFKATDSSQLGV